MIKNKLIIISLIVAGVVGVSAGIAFSVIYPVKKDSPQSQTTSPYVEDIVVNTQEELYEMHDVILDGTIISYSNETGIPYVTMQVNEYFKNPQGKSQLTVRGEFGLTGGFCAIPDNCTRLLAFLYQDENGNLSSGETWAWLSKECDARCMLEKPSL